MIGIIAAISEGTWAFLGVLITNAVLLAGFFVRQGRQGEKVDQINRAVNHQGADAPTLIQRVIAVERRTEEIADDTTAHRQWQHRVFSALANHVGFQLPDDEHPSWVDRFDTSVPDWGEHG